MWYRLLGGKLREYVLIGYFSASEGRVGSVVLRVVDGMLAD